MELYDIPKIAEPYMLALAPLGRNSMGVVITVSDSKVTETVLTVVANAFALSVEQIKTRPRRSLSTVVLARHISAYLIWKTSTMSLPAIAKVLGWNDHTTAMYARKRVTALVDTSPKHADAIARAEAEIRAALA